MKVGDLVSVAGYITKDKLIADRTIAEVNIDKLKVDCHSYLDDNGNRTAREGASGDSA